MVEKDFRKIITDLELDSLLKQERVNLAKIIESAIVKYLSDQIELTRLLLIGSWAKNTMLKSDPLELLALVNLKKDFDLTLANKLIINEIETALIYGLNLDQIERNFFSNELKIKIKPDIDVNLFIKGFDDEKEKNLQFVEYANQEYTYFKNTILIIKYASDELKLKLINEEMIEVILYYSLNHYQIDNKYYDYLGAFCKGLEDFFAGRKIEVSNKMYDKLATVEGEILNNSKYQVISCSNKRINLADGINEINIGDYRRLRKKLAKMLENPKEDKFIFDNSTEVIVDVNPVYNPKNNNYAWSFVVVGKGLFNQGGEYKDEESQIQTAILKGLFKGLKALEENGLLKKKIYLQCNYDDILGAHMLSTGENKSRIRTINNYITTNKLNVAFTKGNVWEE